MSSQSPPSASPSIYKRVNIRWLPNGFEEPASTLVVSSPSGCFVDLRIDLAKPHDIDPETGLPITSTGSVGQRASENAQFTFQNIGYSGSLIEEPSSLSTLSWAVGGYSSYSSNEDGNITGTWTQWVSYIPSPFKNNEEAMQEQEDTGVMSKRLDGSTLESGSMINPATGRLTDYQETWVDVPVADTLPFSQGSTRNKGCYLVAKTETVDGDTKGMIVWAGQVCQGMLRYTNPNKKQTEIIAERWQYDVTASTTSSSQDGSEVKSAISKGQWARVFKHGDDVLPCQWMLNEAHEKWEVGKSLNEGQRSHGIGSWIVTETNFGKD